MGSSHQEILYNEAWFQKKYRLWNQTALVQNPNFDIYSLGELGRLTSPSLLLLVCRMTVIIPALEDMEKELNENIYVKYLGEYLVHGWCQIYISCHWYKERVASAAPWRMVGMRGGKVSTAWAKSGGRNSYGGFWNKVNTSVRSAKRVRVGGMVGQVDTVKSVKPWVLG